VEYAAAFGFPFGHLIECERGAVLAQRGW